MEQAVPISRMRSSHGTEASARHIQGESCGRSYLLNPMLWSVLVLLLILWALGFGFHVAGSLIHVLLVAALVVLILQLFTGRRIP